MYKISDIISMPVISMYESNNIGIISNLLFDTKTKKCKYLLLFDENEMINKVIKTQNIYSIGQDCIYIKNNSYVELEENQDMNFSKFLTLMNLRSYSYDGQYLGKINEIILDENLYIKDIVLNNNTILNSQSIFNIGSNVIVNTSQTHLQLSRFKPKQNKVNIKNHKEQKVVILDTTTDINPPKSDTIIKESQETKIDRIVTDYRFLIGRTINQDILSSNGEIIVKKGNAIDKSIVNKATLYGKLMEIARYSK